MLLGCANGPTDRPTGVARPYGYLGRNPDQPRRPVHARTRSFTGTRQRHRCSPRWRRARRTALLCTVFGVLGTMTKRGSRGDHFGGLLAPRLTVFGRRRTTAEVRQRRRRDGGGELELERRGLRKLQESQTKLGDEYMVAEELSTVPETTKPEVEEDRRGNNDEIRRPWCSE